MLFCSLEIHNICCCCVHLPTLQPFFPPNLQDSNVKRPWICDIVLQCLSLLALITNVAIDMHRAYKHFIRSHNSLAGKGNGFLPRLTLAGDIWQRLWLLDSLLFTRQHDTFYSLAPSGVQGHWESQRSRQRSIRQASGGLRM